MTFTYTFQPQAKPTQKIDSDIVKEITVQNPDEIKYAKELDMKQITERAADDLTGASYVSSEDGMTPTEMAEMIAKMWLDEYKKNGLDDNSSLKESADKLTGNPSNGNNTGDKDKDINPNPFDDTTGDPPGVPTNPKGGAQQQGSNDVTTFGSGGIDDPTNPDGGCEGDFDFWRPNPEEFKDFGSLSVVDFNDMSSSSEVDLLLHSMSVDTMGL